MNDGLKPCPFCGSNVFFKTIPDPRSAEFVGPWRVVSCSNDYCKIKPYYALHTDGKWVQGKGTPQGLNRDDELRRVWNTRDKLTNILEVRGHVEDKTDAILARLGDGWRPIESAPRDGTHIIIYVPTGRLSVCEAHWSYDYEGAPGNWTTPRGISGRGYSILPEAPTHWRPLPSPPKESA